MEKITKEDQIKLFNKICQIAQWVIDNRYPKSENEKMSDSEMYQLLVEKIDILCNKTNTINV